MADENPGSGGSPGNPAPTDGAGQTPDWTTGLAEADRGFALNKGWKDPAAMLNSYRNLETLFGADKAGRTLQLPGENATPEEKAEFAKRLGVPEKATDYTVAVPEGFPEPKIGEMAQGLLHKHGIPKAQGEALIADFIKLTADGHTGADAAEQQKFAAEEAALKDAWGDKFNQNIEIAKRGAKKLGLDDAVIDQLETKSGFAGVIKALHQAGVMLGEGAYIDGGGAGGGPAGAETLEQLQAKRAALVRDAAWARRFNANDATARREYDDINRKIAALAGT